MILFSGLRLRYSLASIDVVNALNVEISSLFKKLQQYSLDTLALVKHGLCADLQSADRAGFDVVFLEKGGKGCQGQRVDVFSIIAETHSSLAEPNGVFAGSHAIKFLEL